MELTERFMNLWQELDEAQQKAMLAALEGLAYPECFEIVRQDTLRALRDPLYRCELALEVAGFMPTKRGEQLMSDPVTRAYFGREIQRDLPALEGKHLMAVAMLVLSLARNNAGAPSKS